MRCVYEERVKLDKFHVLHIHAAFRCHSIAIPDICYRIVMKPEKGRRTARTEYHCICLQHQRLPLGSNTDAARHAVTAYKQTDHGDPVGCSHTCITGPFFQTLNDRYA
ncbi:MAG: hypothetical protein A4E63_02223 [Syntrophorhabdus sp. PtaU1.Bin050]|nr:MAG: hypothetical protein A4E63_02223 [Syntrophorhabdus sp. PtaU1.Bin050]